jgi:hypothetical protein
MYAGTGIITKYYLSIVLDGRLEAGRSLPHPRPIGVLSVCNSSFSQAVHKLPVGDALNTSTARHDHHRMRSAVTIDHGIPGCLASSGKVFRRPTVVVSAFAQSRLHG